MKLFTDKIKDLFTKQDTMIRNYIYALNKDIVLRTDTEKLALLTAARFKIDNDLKIIPAEKIKISRMAKVVVNSVPFKKATHRAYISYAVVDFMIPWDGNRELWKYKSYENFNYSFEASLTPQMLTITVQTDVPHERIDDATFILVEEAAVSYIRKLEAMIQLVRTDCSEYNGGLFKFCLEVLEGRLKDFGEMPVPMSLS